MCDEAGQMSDEAVLRMVLVLIFVTHWVTIFVTQEGGFTRFFAPGGVVFVDRWRPRRVSNRCRNER
jgi:hypothetical protein